MEQKINSLEEEMKVLKSQIKAVLLDIKEYMATAGNGQPCAPLPSGGGPAGAGPAEGHAGSGPINVSSYGAPGPVMAGGYVGPAPTPGGGYHGQEAHAEDREAPVHAVPLGPKAETAESHPGQGDGGRSESRARSAGRQSGGSQRGEDESGQVESAAAGESGEDQALDLLTVSVLAQWLARAMPAVGRGQIGKLVEIYDITGNLPPRLKDTMLLLADLCAGGEPDEDAAKADSVPAAVSVQLLIELDSLLRYRNGAVESVVMSLLLDKGQGTKKDGHG